MASGKAVWRISRKTVWRKRRGFSPPPEELKWAELTCAFCRGRGRDPFMLLSPLSNCPVCHGRGTNQVVEPYETCSACDGTGLYFGSKMYCWHCKGKGVVPIRIKKEVLEID